MLNNSAGIKVVTEYLPAHAVGGDFYDFVDLGGGRVFGVIGDVSGKGVTAGLTMARVSADVRRFATDVSARAPFLTTSRVAPLRAGRSRGDPHHLVGPACLVEPRAQRVSGERQPLDRVSARHAVRRVERSQDKADLSGCEARGRTLARIEAPTRSQ